MGFELRRKGWRKQPGDVFEIDLGDGAFGYGRVLHGETAAFYDLHVEATPDLDTVLSAGVLFRIGVMRYAFSKGIWRKLGHRPLNPELEKPIIWFRQDALNKRLFIHEQDGCETPATFDEVEGLERLAGWDPEHLVDRLRDHFAGRPNVWLESLRPTPQP